MSWLIHPKIYFCSILQVTSGSMIANRSCQWSSMSKEGFPVGVKGGSMGSLSWEGHSGSPSLLPTSGNWGTRRQEICWVLLNNRMDWRERKRPYNINQTSPKLKMKRQTKLQQNNLIGAQKRRNRLYLFSFCEGKVFLKQPQTLLEGEMSLQIEWEIKMFRERTRQVKRSLYT